MFQGRFFYRRKKHEREKEISGAGRNNNPVFSGNFAGIHRKGGGCRKSAAQNTTISVYKTVYTYNGRVQKPAVSVRYRGKKLSVNKDYTLVYSKGRKNPGVYTVT